MAKKTDEKEIVHPKKRGYYIRYGFNNDFVNLISRLKNKYGEKIFEIHGIGDRDLDITQFPKKFYNKSTKAVASVSIDANANVNSKDISQYSYERFKPQQKLNSIYLLYKWIKKVFSKRDAEKAVERIISGDLFVSDLVDVEKSYSYYEQNSIFIRVNGQVKNVTLLDLFNYYKEFVVKLPDREVIDAEHLYKEIDYLDTVPVSSVSIAAKKRKQDYFNPEDKVRNIHHIEVLDSNGKWTKLKQILRHKKHNSLLCYQTNNGDFAMVTEDHPVILADGTEVNAGDLKVGMEIKKEEPELKLTETVDISTDLAYIIGFLLGDDNPLRLKAIVSELFGISYGNSPYRMALPNNILDWKRESIEALICGLIDREGTINPENSVNLRMKAYALVTQLYDVLRALGIESKKCFHEKSELFSVIFYPTEAMFKGSVKLSIRTNTGYDKPSIRASKENTISKIHKMADSKVLANGEYIYEYVYDITTESGTFYANGMTQHNCFSIDLNNLLADGMDFFDGKNIKIGAPKRSDSFIQQVIQTTAFISNQIMGAIAYPSFFPILDKFYRAEFGEDYINRYETDELMQYKIKNQFQNLVYSFNFPFRGNQCVDLDTEVLTPNGFKKYNELHEGDDIYTWNKGKLNIQRVLKVNVHDFDGEMHSYSSKDLTQFVTPNHRVLYKDGEGNWSIKESSKLIDQKSIVIPTAFVNNTNSDYAITDERLVIDFSDINTQNELPPYFNKLSKEQALKAIEVISDNNFIKVNTSKAECEVQHLAMLACLSTRVVDKENHIISVNNDKECCLDMIKKVQYKGKVWCPTTEDGVVVFRKNGATFISGNSSFTNLSVLDHDFAHTLFDGFTFADDGTHPNIDSSVELSKKFFEYFVDINNKEAVYTFPVMTLAVSLDEKNNYNDESIIDWIAEVNHEKSIGNIFQSKPNAFCSCCFDGKQKVLTKSSAGISLTTIKDVLEGNYDDLHVLHNGSWCSATPVILEQKRPMYKVTTANNKVIYVTDNHLNLTKEGLKETKDLVAEKDYIAFNVQTLQDETKEASTTLDEAFIEDENGNYRLNRVVYAQSTLFRKQVVDMYNTFIKQARPVTQDLTDEIEALYTTLGTVYDNDGNLLSNTTEDKVWVEVTSIEPYEYEDSKVYCFQMKNEDEPYFTLPNGIITHNCRLKNELDVINEINGFGKINSFGASSGLSVGSHRVCGINLPRLAMMEKENPNQLNELMDSVHKILYAHRMLIKERINLGVLPLYTHGWMDLKRQYSTVGLIGGYEYVKNKGLDILTEDGTNALMKVMKTVESKILGYQKEEKNCIYNIESIPGESQAVKLCDIDKILGYCDPKVKLYSNQYVSLMDECSIYDRMKTQGIFDSVTSGGAIMHCTYKDSTPLTKEQYKSVVKMAKDLHNEYFAINYTYVKCSNGHRSIGEKDTCDICGEPITTRFQRVVGFITCVEAWNPVRREYEYKRRTSVKAEDANANS